jgi:predicted N-acetyltransferase YhbS
MIEDTAIVVRDFRPEDRDAAVRVLTDAFIDFPPVQIVVGTGQGAAERLRRMDTITFPGKSVVLVAERDGQIVGVLTHADPPDCYAMTPRQMLGLVRIIGPRLLGTIRLFRATMRAHPKMPHRHLSQVAVDPSAQRLGVGAALMAVYCARCDEAGLPGYLETIAWTDSSRPSQRRLYERFGFEVAHESPGGDEWSGLSMIRPVTSADTVAPAGVARTS